MAWFFGSSGGHRGGFGMKLPKSSPMSDRADPGGSRTDLPLSKVGLVRNGSYMSVIKYLGRQKPDVTAAREE